jgi:hypothetical protein
MNEKIEALKPIIEKLVRGEISVKISEIKLVKDGKDLELSPTQLQAVELYVNMLILSGEQYSAGTGEIRETD